MAASNSANNKPYPCAACQVTYASAYHHVYEGAGKKNRCPTVCFEKHGNKHKLCDNCLRAKADKAFVLASLREAPVLKCGFPKCKEVWTYQDLMNCSIVQVVERLLKTSLEVGLSKMDDIRYCPQCSAAGWIEAGGCPSAVCAKCNFLFCTLCQQRAHKGVCGSPQDEPDMADKPDKYFNLDQVIGSNVVLRRLYGQQTHSRRKALLSNDCGVVFGISDLLNFEECVALLTTVKGVGFDSLEKIFPSDYRSNDRLLTRSKVLADVLFNRLIPHLTSADLRHTPMGPTGEGLWIPFAINEVFKFARYRPGCFFKVHRDGPWVPSIDQMSVFTVVIYLNSSASYYNQGDEGFKGGETRFFDETNSEIPTLSVSPEMGKAIVFTQAMRHDGARLKGETGAKYILRTEIMYRRIKSVLDRSPALLAACEDLKRIAEAYKKSTEGVDSEKPETFIKEYLLAIELQAKPRPQSQRLPLPDDVVVQCLSYMSDRDILNFGRISKACYRLSRDNGLWRLRLRQYYPDIAYLGSQDLTMDWFARYRTECQQRRMSCPHQRRAAIDLGSGLLKFCLRGDKPVCAAAYYTAKTEEFMSHGGRYTVDVLNLQPAVALIKHEIPTEALRAVTDDSVITNKGIEVIRNWSDTLRSFNDAPLQTLVVLPDDWDERRHQKQYLFLSSSFGSFGWLYRFVASSAAVAKRFNLSSAVVLMLGHSNQYLSVVENGVVTRTKKIVNFKPNPAASKAIARAVHKVLLSKKGRKLLFREVNEVESSVKEVVNAVTGSKNATMEGFKTAAVQALKNLEAVNPSIEDLARQSVGYRLLVTGGRTNALISWIDELKSALYKRSDKWHISFSNAPHCDTVIGASRLPYREEPVFFYALGQPTPVVKPLVIE